MLNESMLIENGFKLIGEKKNGLKVYARKSALDDSRIVLHKVDAQGESFGVEFFEVETLKILKDAELI